MGIACFKVDQENVRPAQKESFFDLKANDITGKRIDFYVYKNRKAFLLVNVATKSIGAKEYFKMLNEIYNQYGEHGLQILAFPCGQFSSREPKTNEQIRATLTKHYDIKFSVFEKIDVNGLNTHPVYKYLRNQPLMLNQHTGKSKTIPENFTICLLNKDGELIRCFKPSRDYDQMKRQIKKILTQQKIMTQRSIKDKGSVRTIKSIRAIN